VAPGNSPDILSVVGSMTLDMDPLGGHLSGLDVEVVVHTQIYPGYDKIAARYPRMGAFLRRVTYTLENTPVRVFGLSHFVVVGKGQRTMGFDGQD